MNKYYIEITSIPKINESALKEICEHIEKNYGINPKDVKAETFDKSKIGTIKTGIL